MADLRISDLVTASQLKNDDYYEISQSESGTRVSYKATLLAIAVQIATMVDFTSDLNTTSKKITGAINELRQLISLIPQFSIEVVQELPTEDISDTTIYLVPAEDPEAGNYYEEYIHVNDAWELVGTTAVDLSAYYTKLEVDGLLATKASVADVALKENKSDMPTDVRTIIKDCKTPKSATITNGIAQFECIEENLVKALKVEMNPIQDLHGYSNPWPGGAGKNKFSCVDYLNPSSNLSATKNADGSVRIYGTPNSTWAAVSDLTDCDLPAGQYTFSIQSAVAYNIYTQCYVGGTNTNRAINAGQTSITFTVSGTITQIRLMISGMTNGTPIDITIKPMLASGTDTVFEPYSNICPISGRTEASVTMTGKNLFDTNNFVNGYIDTSTGEIVPSTRNATTDFIKAISDKYTFSSKNSCYALAIGFYDSGKNFISKNTVQNVKYNSVTIPSNCAYIRAQYNKDNSSDVTSSTLIAEEIQLEFGNTATSYEPYTAETHTHQYGQTVYGGEDDFVSGSCKSEVAKYTLGNITAFEAYQGNYYATYRNVPNIKNVPNFTNDIICDRLSYVGALGDYYSIYHSAQVVVVTVPRNCTVEEYNSKISGADIIYPLSSPTTIETSAENITTVEGTNIISGTEPISECKYTELATVDDLRKIIGGQ